MRAGSRADLTASFYLPGVPETRRRPKGSLRNHAACSGPRLIKSLQSELTYLCPKRATKNLTRLSWSNVEAFENSGSATLSRSTRPDQGSVVPIVLAPHKLLERFGERGWNRTFNLLIPYQQPTSQWFQRFPMSFR